MQDEFTFLYNNIFWRIFILISKLYAEFTFETLMGEPMTPHAQW